MTSSRRGHLPAAVAAALIASSLALPAAANGQEVPTCGGQPATIWGSEGDDRGASAIVGTPGDDVIAGLGGNDTIRGLGGDDVICGGNGIDSVLGGPGDDQVYGGAGDDFLSGGPGNDTLWGDDGSDQISGDGGKDRAYGGEGPDVVYGGSGADTLYGEGGNDRLFGGAGRDRLWGGDGDDEASGDDGADRLFGGAGGDYLWGDAYQGEDPGGDLLVGDDGDDLLQGGEGADRLRGGGGYDELWGSECYEIHLPFPHFCRGTPTGRPPAGGAADPGDTLNGGPAFDGCNRGTTFSRCEVERGWRPKAPWHKEAADEWRPVVVQAFEERVAYILGHVEEYPAPPGPGAEVLAQMVEDEIEHAMQIVACESLADPFQVTPFTQQGTTVNGLFQHNMKYWGYRSEKAGVPGASPFDPLSNARVAAWLVADSLQWGWDDPPEDNPRPAWWHWACDEAIVKKGLWEEPAP